MSAKQSTRTPDRPARGPRATSGQGKPGAAITKPRARRSSGVAHAANVVQALQLELAALLFEPGRMDSFAAAPKRHLRQNGVTGRAATLLAGLDPDGARYFASRRRIDRAHYLGGDMPRTMALLEQTAGVGPYLDGCPYAKESPLEEVAQLLAWLASDPEPPRSAIHDVAQIEATGLRLFAEPHQTAKPGRFPRAIPGLEVLHLVHDPDQLLGDDPIAAPIAPTFVALVREVADVEVYRLSDGEAAVLGAANGRRSVEAIHRSVAWCTDRAACQQAIDQLVRRGFLLTPG